MSTAKDLVSKSLASRVNPDVSTLGSFLFALPFYAIAFFVLYLAGWEGGVVTKHFLLLVLLRGISDVCAEGCKMRAFNTGDVSLVSGLLSLSPLILTAFTPFVTGDSVHLSEVVGILLIVVGGLVLVRRDRETGKVSQPTALLYALGGSCAFALNTALDRLAVGHSGPVMSGFAMTICAAILMLPTMRRVPTAMGEFRANIGSFLTRGGFETVFMVAKMMALTSLSAHVVAGLTRMSMVFTVIAGGAWFKEQDRGRRIVGTAIMYVGLLALIL